MGKILRAIKGIDLLGPSFNLEGATGIRFKSYQGAILSFALYGFLVSIAFIFGVELWEKKKPLISLTKITKPNSEFSLSRFPLIFSLYNKDMSNIYNLEDYLTFSITEVIGAFSDIGNTNAVTRINKYRLFKCNLDEQYEFYKGQDYSSYGMLCPDFNDTTILRNEITTSNSSNYIFSFYKCDSSKRKCADKLDEVFESLIFYFSYVDSYIDPTNYTNPVKYYEVNRPIYLSNMLQKSLTFNFENSELNTDKGIIFEDIQSLNFVSLSKTDIEYSIIDPKPEKEKIIITLNSLRQVTKSDRYYLKTQELFAKIGGLANALIILFNLLFGDYLRFQYLEHINEGGLLVSNEIKRKKNLNDNSQICLSHVKFKNGNAQLPIKNEGGLFEQAYQKQVEIAIHKSPEILKPVVAFEISPNATMQNKSYLTYCLSRLPCKSFKSNYYERLLLSKKVLSFHAYTEVILTSIEDS